MPIGDFETSETDRLGRIFLDAILEGAAAF